MATLQRPSPPCPIMVLHQSLTTFRELCKTLRESDTDWESRGFYAQLIAYFLMISEALDNIPREAPECVMEITGLLVKAIKPNHLWATATPQERLSTLSRQWISLLDQADSKREFASQAMDFGANTARRNIYLQELDSCERTVRALLPEDPREMTVEGSIRFKTLPEPSCGISSASHSVFIGLADCCKTCSCHSKHDFWQTWD